MILIKNGRIVDPVRQFDDIADILIEGKNIVKVGKNLKLDENDSNLRVIDASGLVAAPGLVDAHVHFRDPLQREVSQWLCAWQTPSPLLIIWRL